VNTEQLARSGRFGRSAGIGDQRISSRALIVTAILAAAFSSPGCGDRDLPPALAKQAVKFDEVPEAVRAAARKAVPQVNFNEAWKNVDREGKLHSYEIRGKNPADGKIREVRVSLTGEILEME
jgi:hypothetical protein